MAKELKGEAGVARDVFLSPAVRREHSIAARMSWAKGRHTTRIEDRAYSLLGLFEIVNMPAVYGEGQQWFSRLHETIMNTQQDDSIFFGGLTLETKCWAFLATNPTSPTNGQGFLSAPDNVPLLPYSHIMLTGECARIGQAKRPTTAEGISSRCLCGLSRYLLDTGDLPSIPTIMKM